jgi:hypothetical protein
MTPETIKEAELEAKRFLARVAVWRKAQGTTEYNGHTYANHTPRESGALRRASLDLTRALAAMRKP